ncbi:MAG: ABC transporter substrate-binding protein [Deltaproteobacteria bacterium]|nr:ABC transporter substrate-binding protein [Deltaproteobacteria bacterium]
MGRKIGFCLLTTALLSIAPFAEAQQPKTPRIGYLAPVFPCSGSVPSLEAFKQGLRELGYVEGQNITVECRSAEGKSNRLPDLAVELVSLKVNIIIAAGGELVARAAKQATQTTPIVMTNVADPVRTGLVASLARPGGNVTRLVTISPELSGKRLELLKKAFPRVFRVAVLTNPANPEQEPRVKGIKVAAQALGVQAQILEVREPNDFNKAFSAITKERAHALLPLGDPLMNSHGTQIVDFAAKNRLPAMYHRMEFVDAGGLMAYGPSYDDLFRRAAVYVDKILKGAKPGDLPVEQPTKFEFIINLKTAKQIGLTIPPNVLARADKVVR